jgi:hypothetical protein
MHARQNVRKLQSRQGHWTPSMEHVSGSSKHLTWEHQKPSSIPFSISGWAILAISLRITRGRCASSRCWQRLLQRRLLRHSAMERHPVPALIDMHGSKLTRCRGKNGGMGRGV